ncbi:hypothetical protein TSUD_148020 [Trifolium subterraneum]|uniref:Uncharacterized protein n=1 Tax=Trifolium subterraneum TaxID=3900 RepID=A0A2Z6N470_TRISU|nr:hypothetical protein TSUD_148020 [Trifolium subterraneum]
MSSAVKEGYHGRQVGGKSTAGWDAAEHGGWPDVTICGNSLAARRVAICSYRKTTEWLSLGCLHSPVKSRPITTAGVL